MTRTEHLRAILRAEFAGVDCISHVQVDELAARVGCSNSLVQATFHAAGISTGDGRMSHLVGRPRVRG